MSDQNFSHDHIDQPSGASTTPPAAAHKSAADTSPSGVQYGVGPFSVREVAIGGAWLLALIVSFFSIFQGAFVSVWQSDLNWIFAIGLSTAAVFLLALRRLSPSTIRRVGSLGIDQFASVAFSIASVYWVGLVWTTLSTSVVSGFWVTTWVPWVEAILALALVVLSVFAPFIPGLKEDFEHRPAHEAHPVARSARPVTARPKPAPQPAAPVGDQSYGAPQQGAPQQGAPQQGAPQYGAPQYGAPQQGAPGYGAPQYGAPQQGAQQYGEQQYGAPQQGAPEFGAPQFAAPQYGAPQTEAPYGAAQHAESQVDQPQYGAPETVAARDEAPDAGVPQHDEPRFESAASADTPYDQAVAEGDSHAFIDSWNSPDETTNIVTPQQANDAGSAQTDDESAPAAAPVTQQPFWALVPVERDVYDEQTGAPLFRIGPTAWALVLEDRGQTFLVRHDDGRTGLLYDTSGVTRG